MDTLAHARAERTELLDLLSGLTPAQWETPSLCAAWTVREVVAHVLSYEELSPLDVVRRVAAARFSPDAANARRLAELGDPAPDDLLARLRAHLTPTGFTATAGGGIALTDCLVHHQDIRRPLGLPREVDEQRLRRAFPIVLFGPPIRGVLRVHDLRLEATDIAWAFGPVSRWSSAGAPVVRGPAEALLLAIAGRPVADDLDGDGVERLRPRLG